MNLKMPDISKEKAILPLVSLVIGAFYLYLTYIFRPGNRLYYPGVEDRIFTAFLILFIASVLAYIREIYAFAKPAFSFLLSPFSKLHAHIRDNVHPAAKRHAAHIASRVPRIEAHHVATPLARLFSFLAGIVSGIAGALYNFFAKVNEVAAKAVSHAFAYIRKYFDRGKPNYFATLGLAAFLILSPLVIYKQKELVEPAVLIFIAFIILSYWKRLDDRIMIVCALLFLLSCPFLLMMKDGARAELSAIYAYYALCAGVFLQFVDYLQNREKYDKAEETEGAREDDGRHGKVQEVEEGCFRITLPAGKR